MLGAVEHALRRDNARLRDKLADMGKQRDRSIEAHARAAKEAARLAALTDDQAKEIERLTALLDEAKGYFAEFDGLRLRIETALSRIKEPRNDQ